MNEEKPVVHEVDSQRVDKDGYHIRCGCGAQWTQPASSTSEKRDEIFASHVAYFNKPKTKVD